MKIEVVKGNGNTKYHMVTTIENDFEHRELWKFVNMFTWVEVKDYCDAFGIDPDVISEFMAQIYENLPKPRKS